MVANDTQFEQIKQAFERESGLLGVATEFRERGDGGILIIRVANPTDRLFAILERARAAAAVGDSDPPLATLMKKPAHNVLLGPEGRLFLRTLAESLNINRYSFPHGFLDRYTHSVAGAEEQITASANHIVFGRRGAGKSTLLLYALHTRQKASKPSAWVDMQVYARRDDDGVIADVLCDILQQTSEFLGDQSQHQELLLALKHPSLTEDSIREQLPSLRRHLSYFAQRKMELFLFLDDFHVLSRGLQPRLLDVLYSICRGNQLFLKISAIETLTRPFDPQTKKGLEVPHDAQLIPLDYNLTIPDKATRHIEAILNSHATYCGLPSVRRMCTSADVVPRLTWVAAGVPRDALNLFSQAITKAALANRSLVSVSNVNLAASETVNTKLRELEADASGSIHPLQTLLESIRAFCVKQKRRNAFLVEIKTDDDLFDSIRTLVDLRLLHVISEGITIGEAGRKYLGLILDYGFYIGIRAARSVDLFNRQTRRVAYKELRKLPVFDASCLQDKTVQQVD